MPPHASRCRKQRAKTLAAVTLAPLALILFLFVLIALLRIPQPSTTAIPPLSRGIPIAGRWKLVHTALGMPVLPDHIPVPASRGGDSRGATSARVDFRTDERPLRRRRGPEPKQERGIALKESYPQLHFEFDEFDGVDGGGGAGASMEEVASSFRAVALYEKEVAAEARRLRRGDVYARSRRRGSSWTVVKDE
jgi:hypothetical protein